jgi:Uma2 family endonuclease
MPLTIDDFEKLQSVLQLRELDYQLELVEGEVLVMGLSDYFSEEVIAQLVFLLKLWVDPRKLGRVTGSSAGFRLPNNDLRGSDVSFVRAERLRHSPREFAKLVPDLAVEVKSASDRLKPLQEKIQRFLELGTQVGVLVDPDLQTITLYRANAQPMILQTNDTLTIPDLLPGWEITVSDLWPPIFEEEGEE